MEPLHRPTDHPLRGRRAQHSLSGKRRREPSPRHCQRLSHLLSIWKALQILFTSDQASDAWMHAPNDFFNGDSALDVMLGGKVIDIYAVGDTSMPSAVDDYRSCASPELDTG